MIAIKSVEDLAASYDLVIVGAGPAGMSAAITAARFSRNVLVVDENPAPGGQIYRGVTQSPVRDRAILGEDYWKGADLCQQFAGANVAFAPGATLWSVTKIDADAPLEIGVALAGAARMIEARHIILATGALERPFPIPGWTLPGVLSAGAAQIALKSNGLVPDGRVVVAGCGPLLYLLTAQLKAAGANIVAFVDTTPAGAWREAAPYAADFMRSPYFGKGLKLLLQSLRQHRIIRGATGLRAEGKGGVERLIVERKGGEVRLDCDMLLLHHGVIPNINMANAIGCEQRFDREQHCWTPIVDDGFVSSKPYISIAGDGASIAGAESAALRGALAALEAGRRLGFVASDERDRRATPLRAELAKVMRGRRFIDLLYRPARAFLNPADPSTIACRCEEVTVGQVRDTTRELKVPGPNQLKTFLRCGMGPCQGRLCGPTIAEIMADVHQVPMEEVGYYRLRPPFKPISVASVAALSKTEAAVKAVWR